MNRRSFLTRSLGAFAATRPQAQPDAASDDLATLWDADRSIANLENAYWGVMPREISDEYLEQTRS
jgi:hypothetical protein